MIRLWNRSFCSSSNSGGGNSGRGSDSSGGVFNCMFCLFVFVVVCGSMTRLWNRSFRGSGSDSSGGG